MYVEQEIERGTTEYVCKRVQAFYIGKYKTSKSEYAIRCKADKEKTEINSYSILITGFQSYEKAKDFLDTLLQKDNSRELVVENCEDINYKDLVVEIYS